MRINENEKRELPFYILKSNLISVFRVYFNWAFVCANKIALLGSFLWEPGRGNKGTGQQTKSNIVISLQICCCVYTKPWHFLFCLGHKWHRLLKEKSWHSRNDPFHISNSYRDATSCLYYFQLLYNNKSHASLFSILKKQPARAAWKNFFPNIKSIWLTGANLFIYSYL